MNAKKAKERRRIYRYYYEIATSAWMSMKPSWWRFIARRKWKKMKPVLPRVCRNMGRSKNNG